MIRSVVSRTMSSVRIAPVAGIEVRCMSSAASFDLSEETIQVRDQARRYMMDTIHPLAERMDLEDWWPEHIMEELGSQGYLGLTVPEEYGGSGLDFLTAGVVAEQIAYANHQIGISHAAHDNLCANNIFLNGNEDQRRRFLPKLCSGEWVGALGMTEPGAGSDALGAMRTLAVRKGDNYVINGTKMYITNGPIADVILLYAKTSPEKGAAGISAFIIETAKTPGFSVAQKLDKMGYRGSPLGELVFEDCVVPAENLVGAEDAGVAVMMSGLDLERAFISAGGTGVTERALDLSVEWAVQRQQFGKPLASFQMIQDKLARMYTGLESSRTLLYRCLASLDSMEAGAGGRGEPHKLAAATFMHAASVCSEACDEAVQIFGGSGFMRDIEVNRLYRSCKLNEIGGGSMEIRKLIIAQEILKPYMKAKKT